MICAHFLEHIFIKFEQYNKKIQINEIYFFEDKKKKEKKQGTKDGEGK